MQTVEDVINDSQAKANGAFVPVQISSGEKIELVATPVDFRATSADTRTGAPEFGQHTEEVLLDYGCSWEDLAKLRERGVIG